ncbi:MAG: 50S ribosomal protein L6 [Bacteroidia bacterium]
MSRIGYAPIAIPQGVEAKISADNVVTLKGKLGELSQSIDKDIVVKIEDGNITLDRPSDEKEHRAKHGLYRSLLNNMVTGVTQGYKKEMELIGVGYRANANGQRLELSIGYSHPIVFELPKEVKLETEALKGEAPLIRLTSADKQLIGQVAAKIRSFRKPEPYKGKGIKFKGEQLRRKAGKSASKK